MIKACENCSTKLMQKTWMQKNLFKKLFKQFLIVEEKIKTSVKNGERERFQKDNINQKTTKGAKR